MEGTPEFVSYKKLMIFGSEGTGKSSLVKRIERGSFTNEVHTENGKYYNLFKNLIDFVTSKIVADLEQGKTLDLNIYEIRIDDNFVKNTDLIQSFVFECQCVLFLVDITNTDSFSLIKQLITNFDFNKYPYIKKIVVQNKFDLESTRQVSSF